MSKARTCINTVSLAILLSFFGASAPTGAEILFSPNGCHYSVQFPFAPKFKSIHVAGIAGVPEAEILGENGLIRANCLSSSQLNVNGILPYYNNRDLVLGTMHQFAVTNGLLNIEMHYEDSHLGRRATLRGTKKLEDILFIYESIWYISKYSVMTLTVGHLAERFPSALIANFIDSVARQ